jgi:hypothetical protein
LILPFAITPSFTVAVVPVFVEVLDVPLVLLDPHPAAKASTAQAARTGAALFIDDPFSTSLVFQPN